MQNRIGTRKGIHLLPLLLIIFVLVFGITGGRLLYRRYKVKNMAPAEPAFEAGVSEITVEPYREKRIAKTIRPVKLTIYSTSGRIIQENNCENSDPTAFDKVTTLPGEHVASTTDYDGDGNAYDVNKYGFSYDDDGYVVRKTSFSNAAKRTGYQMAGEPRWYEDSYIEYEYDAEHHLIEERRYAYSDTSKESVLGNIKRYEYDEDGHLKSIEEQQYPSGNVMKTKVVCNSNGMPVLMEDMNIQGSVYQTRQYGYYDSGLIAFLEVRRDGKTYSKKEYYYDSKDYIRETRAFALDVVDGEEVLRLTNYSIYDYGKNNDRIGLYKSPAMPEE